MPFLREVLRRHIETTGGLLLFSRWWYPVFVASLFSLVVVAAMHAAAVIPVPGAVEEPVRWIQLEHQDVALGLKPDGTVVWKQSLTSGVHVPYRTDP